MSIPTPRSVAEGARHRVSPHIAAVVQTALAALAAWSLALALLPTDQPAFASIAAVISLGVAHGKRRRRAVELVGGVMLGIAVGSAILWLIGTGVAQIGLLVVLAMTAALLLRGGELVVTEAAVSAILLAAFAPTGAAFSADRILEGLIGGVVALLVAALVFPPKPVQLVSEVTDGLLHRLGAALREIAIALQAGDPQRAQTALRAARALDNDVETLEERLLVGAETASLAPARRRDVDLLRRYERALPQLDFAVRNTRVLARHVSRHARSGGHTPEELTAAVTRLADAVHALAAQYSGGGGAECPRRFALEAAWAATSVREQEPGLSDVVAQVRLVAVDLMRAVEILGAEQLVAVLDDPTEELLAVRPSADLRAAA